MAKEECTTQRKKSGDTSTLRNRKTLQLSEKTYQTLSTPVSEDKNCQTEDDTHSSNGTSAQLSARGRFSTEPPGRGLLALVVGLSFSTRLYKIAEPPHVWWARRLKTSYCAKFLFFFTQCLILVFQLGWDTLRKDGKLLHQQDLLLWCPPSSWKSERTHQRWPWHVGLKVSSAVKRCNMTVYLLYYFTDANRSRRVHDRLWW